MGLLWVSGALQSVQSLRTKRCASTPTTEAVMGYGSTPMLMRRTMAPKALLVCSVESTKWPVSAACGDFCRLAIAHFADHDDVGVLAQEGAQHGRKAQADLRLHLYLVEPLQAVFDRVFHRENLEVFALQLLQRRVQRGGLTNRSAP